MIMYFANKNISSALAFKGVIAGLMADALCVPHS